MMPQIMLPIQHLNEQRGYRGDEDSKHDVQGEFLYAAKCILVNAQFRSACFNCLGQYRGNHRSKHDNAEGTCREITENHFECKKYACNGRTKSRGYTAGCTCRY